MQLRLYTWNVICDDIPSGFGNDIVVVVNKYVILPIAIIICSNLPGSRSASLINQFFIFVSSAFGVWQKCTVFNQIHFPMQYVFKIYNH